MTLTAAEQLFLELVNRARLDPLAESARLGVDLNAGLTPGQLTGAARQVLAADAALNTAATLHSLWMLDADTFSHVGSGGSDVEKRIRDSGYALTGTWRIGENLAWSGSSGSIDAGSMADQHHRQLFGSAGHRVNMMNGAFRETGVGQELGVFTTTRDWNASMITQKFAVSGGRQFITGVVIEDRDGDRFYDIGEGLGGATLSGAGQTTTSSPAGGYALAVGAAAAVTVTLTLAGVSRQVTVDTRPGNVKLDLLSDGTLLSSGSLTLGNGATDAVGLGVAGLTLTGNAGANRLTGGAGNDLVIGGLGADTLDGGRGNDTIWGGAGNDRISDAFGNNEVWAGDGADTVIGGAGNDTLGGGPGNDLVDARAGGRNQLWGGDGADTLWTAAWGDMAGGGAGNDQVNGAAGADMLMGGPGNDTLRGEAGAAALYLGLGDDLGYGGSGNDTILPGAGSDRLWGGAGADRFEFWRGYGQNRIEDFSAADGDVVALGRGMWTGSHGVLTPAQVVQQFGRVTTEGAVMLDFGTAGTTVLIAGLGTLDGLQDQILIL
jgi:serralysin